MRKKAVQLHHRNLPLLLLQGRERVMSYFRPVLNKHRITEQQWRIVRVLLDVSALEPRQIGDLCGISSPSLAGVLERMEQIDLVERRRVDHDQRRVHVSLTAHARQLAATMASEIDATYDAIEAMTGKGLMERVHTDLDELLSVLKPFAAISESAAAMDYDRTHLLNALDGQRRLRRRRRT